MSEEVKNIIDLIKAGDSDNLELARTFAVSQNLMHEVVEGLKEEVKNQIVLLQPNLKEYNLNYSIAMTDTQWATGDATFNGNKVKIGGEEFYFRADYNLGFIDVYRRDYPELFRLVYLLKYQFENFV